MRHLLFCTVRFFLVTDVCEVEYHRYAEELVTPLTNDGSATRDDDLREVVVKGYAVVAESQ
jgi:hypothetical protein